MDDAELMLKTENILLIESNQNEADTILDIIKSLNKKYKCLHFNTPGEAFHYLKNEKMLPQLILFGLTQVDYNSIEFLKNLKMDAELKKIPVVMLSPPGDHLHVLESFNYGVAGYMVKPDNDSELKNTINIIIQYWNMCELPHRTL